MKYTYWIVTRIQFTYDGMIRVGKSARSMSFDSKMNTDKLLNDIPKQFTEDVLKIHPNAKIDSIVVTFFSEIES